MKDNQDRRRQTRSLLRTSLVDFSRNGRSPTAVGANEVSSRHTEIEIAKKKKKTLGSRGEIRSDKNLKKESLQSSNL